MKKNLFVCPYHVNHVDTIGNRKFYGLEERDTTLTHIDSRRPWRHVNSFGQKPHQRSHFPKAVRSREKKFLLCTASAHEGHVGQTNVPHTE